MKRYIAVLLGTIVATGLPASASEKIPGRSTTLQPLPAAWLAAWENPAMEDRPLQIVHGIPPRRATPEGMRYYKDLGLGGIVNT